MNAQFQEPRAPLIVGIGGTHRSNSSSELAARFALKVAARAGARVRMFDGPSLSFPLYNPSDEVRDERATEFVKSLRDADGIVLAAPAYHGGISGLIKNALDYTEDMKSDARVYFDQRSVGTIACAGGWQAAGATLSALRSVVHSLRGWNTPLGVMINTGNKVFDGEMCLDADVARNLDVMAHQVVNFARALYALQADGERAAVLPVLGRTVPRCSG
ncbi:NAD(P)H-dependent oxidoreductase [Bradyrhizobium sp. AUGA SZCCT0222]|uniref:NADPH-dependent FMN reductase n=1 Tax=Bradyrhizobium sp. AUGA SZCCT0222 TaxID=2807668 RepID=UPI001BA9CAF3|nr:NAD(P)H-dependent oxidoreductase [Bradyrhizobium sp. AUGA SZCCT0222]MBR1269696.1 NAD(P)H-dependent oxidoreductase [Bradyrhizobium sp. AUGA SZCCT0222]